MQATGESAWGRHGRDAAEHGRHTVPCCPCRSGASVRAPARERGAEQVGAPEYHHDEDTDQPPTPREVARLCNQYLHQRLLCHSALFVRRPSLG